MNTNSIKSFAREARLLLLDGVFQRLKYWSFQENGTNTENLNTTQGGYIFRGQPFTDVNVPSKWNKLKLKLKNKHSFKDVREEASYTWFNRLMAIKILETNGYISKQLAYTEGSRTPLIVQNAKRGEHNITNNADKELLIEYLKEDKDEEAFALLVINLCHTNTVLRDIFGRIDDYTEILFPQNSLKIDGLLDLINSDAISETDYKEVELIGWLYQFYISDKKDEVFKGFKKNIKARAEDIPAATQIFTPKWIVKYMVENTVGKIYLDYEPDSDLRDQMKYLVENENDNVIASATKQSLIKDLTQLTLIDPAAGSGHILVTGFDLYMKMYREAGYTANQAVQNILQHNLYGLDIDDRAMQLSRFAVLLKAAQYDASILEDPILPHIYSFPEDTLGNWFTQTYYSKSQSSFSDLLGMHLAEPITIEWEETKKNKTKIHKITYKKGDILNDAIIERLQLHGNEAIAVDYSQELEQFWGDKEKPWDYCEFFYAIKLLRQGKNLGSAIKLNISTEVYNHINEQYHNWLLKENSAQLNIEETSIFNLLKPFLEVFLVLANQYKAVVANPPYLKQQSMNAVLKNYVNSEYPISKTDLFAVFMEACLNMSFSNGVMGMINQHSWMFLSSFEKLRSMILERHSIDSMLHLGPRTFEELSGEVVQSTAFILHKNKSISSNYHRLVKYRNNDSKEKAFFDKLNFFKNINPNNFNKIPGKRIGYWFSDLFLSVFENDSLGVIYEPKSGVLTGKDPMFVRNWYESSFDKICFGLTSHEEMLEKNFKWIPITNGGAFKKWYGNLYNIANLENNGFDIKNLENNNHRLRNPKYYFKHGINWTLFMSGKFCVRESPQDILFGNGSRTFFPSEEDFKYLCCLFNTTVARQILDLFNPTTNFVNEDISSVPIVYIKKTEKIERFYDSVYSVAKKDWDSRETSWDFKQSPLVNKKNTLKKSYKNWKDNVTKDFFQLHSNEEELNFIFIDIYGLQDELTPEVALKDITILQEELNGKDLEALESNFRENGAAAISLPINKTEVLSQFISYAMGVFMGRYRLDKSGLNIAHTNPTEQELSPYTIIARNEAISRTITIDDDGIVPLMGKNCAFPDDALRRTEDLLLNIWGEGALTENINFLQDALGIDLNKWLTEKFWDYHTSMYKKKPIYWLFSSNVKKPQQAAFKVLVYMHRMDKYTVQQIQRNYLYPHQEYIKTEIDKLTENEDSLNKEQQKQLELLRDWELECRDYNEVLKTLANQQIEIDLDDGVTVNYAKFEGAVANI